jgi:hypothetical protein
MFFFVDMYRGIINIYEVCRKNNETDFFKSDDL